MRIYGVFKATHSRMHVKWGLGPARENEMNQKCPWSWSRDWNWNWGWFCAITNAIKISCHILITPCGVLYFLYAVDYTECICAYFLKLPHTSSHIKLHLMLTNCHAKFPLISVPLGHTQFQLTDPIHKRLELIQLAHKTQHTPSRWLRRTEINC